MPDAPIEPAHLDPNRRDVPAEPEQEPDTPEAPSPEEPEAPAE